MACMMCSVWVGVESNALLYLAPCQPVKVCAISLYNNLLKKRHGAVYRWDALAECATTFLTLVQPARSRERRWVMRDRRPCRRAGQISHERKSWVARTRRCAWFTDAGIDPYSVVQFVRSASEELLVCGSSTGDFLAPLDGAKSGEGRANPPAEPSPCRLNGPELGLIRPRRRYGFPKREPGDRHEARS